jgi:carbon-monoxide dehydrogenase medium subunit
VKPAPFTYHAPESIDEAVSILAAHGDDARPLAGGQSLVPILALRLTRVGHLVDLGRVAELRGVERRNGVLAVRAMTTQATVEHSEAVAAAVPLIAKAMPFVGHFQIRNRGTVGGSLTHADPASELPAVALALDAELELRSTRGSRVEQAANFFVGTWTTSMDPDELLLEARFPIWPERFGCAVEEVARRHGDFALTGAVCAVGLDTDGKVERAGVALLGMGSTPVRASDAEEALRGRLPSGGELLEIGELAVRDTEPPDDLHASRRYRRTVGARVVSRALGRAIEEAESD